METPSIIKREPALIFLEGIAGVVNLILLALVALNVFSLDGGQITAVIAALQGGATLAALVVRSAVVSPATHELEVREALNTRPPSY